MLGETSVTDLEQLLTLGNALWQQQGHAGRLSAATLTKQGLRNLTVRCVVQGGEVESVILKKIQQEPARGFSEWASLSLLAQIPGAQGRVPTFYGGDIASGVYLLADLGPGQCLQDLLQGGDGASMPQVLGTLAQTMGTLQAASQGYEGVFEHLCQQLPARALTADEEAQQWLQSESKLQSWMAACGVMPPPHWQRARKTLALASADAGNFRAWSHGDPAPTNHHFVAGKAYLLDFEYGAYRHALYDLSAWQILCPLPAAWVSLLRQHFVQAWEQAGGARLSAEAWERGWAEMCAYRAYAIWSWMPPELLTQDRPWAEHWTMRAALLAALSRLSTLLAPWPDLEPLATVAQAMTTALKPWGYSGEILPPWPLLHAGDD
jgi:hypothetical protein